MLLFFSPLFLHKGIFRSMRRLVKKKKKSVWYHIFNAVCISVLVFWLCGADVCPYRSEQAKLLLSFSCLTSEWVPQKYPLQLSSLPHFSISPLSSTLPTPLALSCHTAFLLPCHSVSLVAPALSGRMGRGDRAAQTHACF